MNFWEAYQAMKDGKAVCRLATFPDHEDERTLFIHEDFIAVYHKKYFWIGFGTLWQQDLDATDWKITDDDVSLLRRKFDGERHRY